MAMKAELDKVMGSCKGRLLRGNLLFMLEACL